MSEPNKMKKGLSVLLAIGVAILCCIEFQTGARYFKDQVGQYKAQLKYSHLQGSWQLVTKDILVHRPVSYSLDRDQIQKKGNEVQLRIKRYWKVDPKRDKGRVCERKDFRIMQVMVCQGEEYVISDVLEGRFLCQEKQFVKKNHYALLNHGYLWMDAPDWIELAAPVFEPNTSYANPKETNAPLSAHVLSTFHQHLCQSGKKS